MRILTRAGMAAAAVFTAWGLAGQAGAQELSERSLRSFMEYAWQLTPSKFTRPDGRTIEIDRKKKDEVIVPVDIAREVIRVGRLSAHAQVCELNNEQGDNYRSLMLREDAKRKWTEQQMIYINQLHLTTVMLLTGKIRLVERGEGGREVVVEEAKSNTQTCSNEHRQKVAQMIAEYVKAGPPLNTPPVAATAAASPPATTGSNPGVMPAAAAAPPAPKAQKK